MRDQRRPKGGTQVASGPLDSQMNMALPLRLASGTGPHDRESLELDRLSPMAKKWPCGTTKWSCCAHSDAGGWPAASDVPVVPADRPRSSDERRSRLHENSGPRARSSPR